MRLARHFTASFILFFLVASALHAQSSLLQSGPMLGYSEMREVLLWVQTKAKKIQSKCLKRKRCKPAKRKPSRHH
jgi:hypothetical protein